MRCPTLTVIPSPPPGHTGWPWTAESERLSDTMPNGSPWPRISIVTPSYNQMQFIEMTIRSVLLQGYPNLEYIIMDGGSTDGSVEIIQKYEPWLAYWVSEKDAGQADAINMGWQRSTGEILAWLNSDDYYEPGALAFAAEYLRRTPAAAVLAGDCWVIDAADRRLRFAPAGRFHPTAQLFSDALLQPGMFMRRTALEAVGWLDVSLHHVMDWDLWYRLWFAGYQIEGVRGQPVANYRCWSGSKSGSQAIRFLLEQIALMDHYFSKSDLPGELKIARPAAYYCTHLKLALHYHRLGDDQAARRQIDQAFSAGRELIGTLPDWSFLGSILVDAPSPERIARQFARLVAEVAQGYRGAIDERRIEKAIAAAAYKEKAWAGYQRGDYTAVRQSLWRLACSAPRGLVDRGLWSIGVESAVGSSCMARLRACKTHFNGGNTTHA